MIFEENELIKKLKAFPANGVYSLGPKDVVIRGYQYYQQKRVEGYDWSRDLSVLTASVRGTRRYQVELSLKRGELDLSCTCPAWSPGGQCKHVICLLMTTINLLLPQHFKTPGDHEAYRKFLNERLRIRSLFAEKPSEVEEKGEAYQIVISLINPIPAILIRRAGSNVSSLPQIPAELTQLAYTSLYLKEAFSGHLIRYGNIYPLIIETGQGEVSVEWDPDLLFDSKTELNVAGDVISIKAICLQNGHVCENYQSLWDYVVDFESKKIGRVKDQDGWKLYHHLSEFFPDSVFETDPAERNGEADEFTWKSEGRARNKFDISYNQFQQAQIIVNGDLKEKMLNALTLKKDGEVCSLSSSSYTCALTVVPQKENPDRLILKAECRLGEAHGSTQAALFRFFTFLENRSACSAALRAQKRKEVIFKTFFHLLPLKTKAEREKIITEALAEGDFYKYGVKKEARQVLRYFISLYSEPGERIWLNDGKWVVTETDQRKESLLYQISFELFGPVIFKGMTTHDEMSLPADILYERLPLLYTRLQEEGIELFYDHKRIVTSKWDVSFDAVRKRGIDWFEIKPEIRCNGEEVDMALWLELLNRKGVVKREGWIEILDTKTQEIFQSISEIYQPAAGTAKKNQKEIVRTPRLQIFDWIALRKHGVKIRLSPEDESLIERLTHFETIEKSPLPEKLNATLRPYQKEGYDWLAFLYTHRLGACLADDMGLGKTLQAITLLGGIKEGCVPAHPASFPSPHLIVVPPTLLFNWESEITRFYPDLKVHLYTGKERSLYFKECDIVMTTYGLIRRDIDQLKQCLFHVIILDEAQAVKNIYSDTTGAIRQLRGRFKLVITGTPVENHLGEYYSLMDLCLPGLMGEYEQFKSVMKVDQSSTVERLIRRTRPFVMRRTKEKILKELPPKTESDIYLDLSPGQKALYQQTVEKIKTVIDTAYRTKTGSQAQIIALTAILRLRQLCVSSRLIAPEIKEPSPKIEFLIGQLKELLDEGHSALVFSQFTSFLDILEEALKAEEIRFNRLDGSTPVLKRKKMVEGFQKEGSPSIFLLSLKAGGQGLNLTRASYVFHLDPWWNPAVENQASDRTHRIGQMNKVSVVRILMRHTVEEKMMELKKKKLVLYQAVMEESTKNETGFSISKSDFDYLLADD